MNCLLSVQKIPAPVMRGFAAKRLTSLYVCWKSAAETSQNIERSLFFSLLAGI
jgi:hypothetical protein